MEEVVKILMERDGLSYEEACNLFSDVQDMILDNPDEAEDILLEELGLEMDYIMDFI